MAQQIPASVNVSTTLPTCSINRTDTENLQTGLENGWTLLVSLDSQWAVLYGGLAMDADRLGENGKERVAEMSGQRVRYV